MEACSHLNCNDKATIQVTLPGGRVKQCYTHFMWSYLENPAHTSFRVDKLDGFAQQFRRRGLNDPIPRHELN